MLGISSGVAMVNDLEAGSSLKEQFLTVYLFAQSELRARCIYKPLRNSGVIPKGRDFYAGFFRPDLRMKCRTSYGTT